MENVSDAGSDPQVLIARATKLMREALALLDEAEAHQSAALLDMSLNVLDGWSRDTQPARARNTH